jgi:hypothetical protein
MSTTVTVSPSADGTGLVPLVGAALAGVATVFVAALSDDAECRRMLEAARNEQRAQRFASIRLRTMDLCRLAQSAREANLNVREGNGWMRIDVAGHDSVWATRTPTGVTIAGGSGSMSQVLVANAVSRLTQTLTSRGSTLKPVRQRSAAHPVEFVATGADRKQIHVAVTPAGEAIVDALNHHGPECETVVRDLAAAMEGTITSSCRKPEFFGGMGVRIGGKQRA